MKYAEWHSWMRLRRLEHLHREIILEQQQLSVQPLCSHHPGLMLRRGLSSRQGLSSTCPELQGCTKESRAAPSSHSPRLLRGRREQQPLQGKPSALGSELHRSGVSTNEQKAPSTAAPTDQYPRCAGSSVPSHCHDTAPSHYLCDR